MSKTFGGLTVGLMLGLVGGFSLKTSKATVSFIEDITGWQIAITCNAPLLDMDDLAKIDAQIIGEVGHGAE